MLVAGMFIDLPAAILLLGPIFVPLAQSIVQAPRELWPYCGAALLVVILFIYLAALTLH